MVYRVPLAVYIWNCVVTFCASASSSVPVQALSEPAVAESSSDYSLLRQARSIIRKERFSEPSILPARNSKAHKPKNKDVVELESLEVEARASVKPYVEPIANSVLQDAIASKPAGPPGPPVTSHMMKASKLLWVFGCSLDTQAIVAACRRAGSDIHVPGNGNSWTNGVESSFTGRGWSIATKICTMDDVTIFFTFHPGATPPPYQKLVARKHDASLGSIMFETTTEDIAMLAASQMNQTFGALPDAVVADSSLWDVGGWWVKDGEPQNWPFPSKWIQEWSDTTMPKFLDFIHNTMHVQTSRVAFRSAPPMQDRCAPEVYWACQGGKIIDTMYNSMLEHVDTATLQLFGKYHFLDYHKIVLSQAEGLTGPLWSHYNDFVHPKPELSRPYVASMLDWVKGLK